jgi:hypothetical protein
MNDFFSRKKAFLCGFLVNPVAGIHFFCGEPQSLADELLCEKQWGITLGGCVSQKSIVLGFRFFAHGTDGSI